MTSNLGRSICRTVIFLDQLSLLISWDSIFFSSVFFNFQHYSQLIILPWISMKIWINNRLTSFSQPQIICRRHAVNSTCLPSCLLILQLPLMLKVLQYPVSFCSEIYCFYNDVCILLDIFSVLLHNTHYSWTLEILLILYISLESLP